MYICYVKIKRLHILFSLLLLASFNAFSNPTFDYEQLTQDLNPRNYDYLQADQNKQALFLEETSITSIQIDSEDHSGNFSFSSLFLFSSASLIHGQVSKAIAPASQDIKYFLEHHIFPFHLFW